MKETTLIKAENRNPTSEIQGLSILKMTSPLPGIRGN